MTEQIINIAKHKTQLAKQENEEYFNSLMNSWLFYPAMGFHKSNKINQKLLLHDLKSMNDLKKGKTISDSQYNELIAMICANYIGYTIEMKLMDFFNDDFIETISSAFSKNYGIKWLKKTA